MSYIQQKKNEMPVFEWRKNSIEMMLNRFFLKNDGKTDFRSNNFESWIIRGFVMDRQEVRRGSKHTTSGIPRNYFGSGKKLMLFTGDTQKEETFSTKIWDLPNSSGILSVLCHTGDGIIFLYLCKRHTSAGHTLPFVYIPAVSKVERLVWMTALWSSLKCFAYPSWLAPQF